MIGVRHLNSTATQTIAPRLSTVHKGNAFEERGLKLLQDHLSMSLRRVGGKSDGGIDLQGWWWLPPTFRTTTGLTSDDKFPERHRLRVFAQCKAEKKKFSPNYVREMEGVLHRYITHEKMERGEKAIHPHVALLLSESKFTTSTLLRAQSSPIPFFLLHLPPIDNPTCLEGEESQGNIGAAFWNPALGGQRGILNGQIEARWERAAVAGGEAGRPGLWWQGKKLKSWTPDGEIPELEDGFELPGL